MRSKIKKKTLKHLRILSRKKMSRHIKLYIKDIIESLEIAMEINTQNKK
jgi:hypothetical protein